MREGERIGRKRIKIDRKGKRERENKSRDEGKERERGREREREREREIIGVITSRKLSFRSILSPSSSSVKPDQVEYERMCFILFVYDSLLNNY